jgi:hypothetical protein
VPDAIFAHPRLAPIYDVFDGDRSEVTDVSLPFVSFRDTYRFRADGTVVTSDSTLRFRSRAELETSLVTQGYRVLDVREAPDRPGREFVFIAQRATERADSSRAPRSRTVSSLSQSMKVSEHLEFSTSPSARFTCPVRPGYLAQRHRCAAGLLVLD